MRLRSVLRARSGDSLDAALESGADAILLALTDETVPVEELRSAVAEGVERIAEAGKTALVTVNHPRTQLTRADLDAITGPRLGAILLPHCTEPQDVRDTAVLLREFEHTRGIEPGQVVLFPVVDTARGLLRMAESLAAAPRTAGLVLAAEAFAGTWAPALKRAVPASPMLEALSLPRPPPTRPSPSSRAVPSNCATWPTTASPAPFSTRPGL